MENGRRGFDEGTEVAESPQKAKEEQEEEVEENAKRKRGGYHDYQKPQSPPLPSTMREVSLTPGKATARTNT